MKQQILTLENKYPLLHQINSPDDLKQLTDLNSLQDYCDQLRGFLVETIGNQGGHFASNLGTVELSVALHYLYNSPHDKLIWDVGHQAYPHKIITGRRDAIHSVRQLDGIHPFPSRNESEHDILTVGHSSTSISAAIALSYANSLDPKLQDNRVFAIIGDGAITGGMAFEALNHGGTLNNLPLRIIFNDNQMSISENVGALNDLEQKSAVDLSPELRKLLAADQQSGQVRPSAATLQSCLDQGMVSVLNNDTNHYANIFQSFGFIYLGPFDGHDLELLLELFKEYDAIQAPIVFHIKTIKGKGFDQAELDPIKFHGVGSFLKNQTAPLSSHLSYSQVFGKWLCARAPQQSNLIAITPAMREGSGMVEFSQQFPQQYFDVAIAEQHAVTLAAGFAIAGYKPVVAIYSSFLQRAYDQLIHDVAIDNLDVTFAIDRAGLVGADGKTHQGAFDLSYLLPIPNMVITTPCNGVETWDALDFALNYQGPVAVRYPKGETNLELSPELEILKTPWKLGKGVQLKALTNPQLKVAILNFSTLLELSLELTKELGAALYNMRFVKPLDLGIIQQLIDFDLIITIEENSKIGGAGSATIQALQQLSTNAKIHLVAIPDQFINHATVQEQATMVGWNKQQILAELGPWLQLHKNK